MCAFISLALGTVVEKDGRRYVITHHLDLETVLAKDLETGISEPIKIKDIVPVSNLAQSEKGESELSLIDQDKWKEAESWYGILRPLLFDQHLSFDKVKKVADEACVHPATVYRKLNQLRRFGKVSALIKEKPSGGRGKSRLQPEVDAVIIFTIDDFYYNKEKKKHTKQETIEEVERRLRNAGLHIPHSLTIYNRIKDEEKRRERKQYSGGISTDIQQPLLPIEILGADYPLALIQIDHTQLDLVLVDDVYRLSIGRPWITVAIDVFSRMVLGFYISLDPPGNIGTGQCIAHSLLKKETWLAGHDIDISWPCWGVMDKIHADNAGEFRGDMLKRACKEYSIDLEWRPVKNPRYGAHIERLLGTFLIEIHKLPGTTFSDPETRGDYDSEKHAAMTLSELEKWLALYITGRYHQYFHEAIGTTPIKRYEQGIFGTDKVLGRGFPLQIRDEDKLRLDLLPAITRTIQEYGVSIDLINYYSGVLRRWANAPDPDHPKEKRKFIFKRDPRDISVIYFYDPELKQYYKIPYRDTSHPPMSIWEYREVRRYLKQQGINDVDERLIFDTLERMRAVVENSVLTSKSARRAAQRRRMHQQTPKPQTADSKTDNYVKNNQDSDTEDLPDIKPFDEVEN